MAVKLNPSKQVPVLIAASVLILIGFLHFAPHFWPNFDLFQRVEWITYDWRVREAATFDPAKPNNLGLVFVSDDSISAIADGTLGFQYGLYWPRHIYGRVVRELHAQGAKAIGFDVLFGGLRPDHQPTTLPDKREIGSDEFFAYQIRRSQNVLLAASRGVIPPSLFKTNAFALGHIDADSDQDAMLRRAKAFRDYRDWHELIRQFASANGANLDSAKVEQNSLTFQLSDGKPFIIKLDNQQRFDLYTIIDKPSSNAPPLLEPAYVDRRIWHMGITLAAVELGIDLSKAKIDLEHGLITLTGKQGVERQIPVDHEGYMFIDWSIPIDSPTLTRQSLEGLVEQDNHRTTGETAGITNLWKDKLVIIGSTASGNDLSDIGPTPLEKRTFLIGKHWNVANSILRNRFITRSSAGMEVVLLLLMVAASFWITVKLHVPWSSVAVVIVGIAYVGIATWVFVEYRYWVPIIIPACGALGLTHVSLVTYQVIFEKKEKRKVKDVFNKLVSPNVVHELLQAEKLNLGGSRRNITVFFADVRGFTLMTDKNQADAEAYVREHKLTGAEAEAHYDQSAQETLETVNTYLATIADQIKKHGGTLDKYIGDCVMAFWGAPTANVKHASDCVRSAMDAQRAMYALNQERDQENKRRQVENVERAAKGLPPLTTLPLLALGTGINTGVCIVGLMGSDAHILNFTVFGREVNLASRLEGVSGRGRIIIGDATYKELLAHDPELASTCVALPPVLVKGIAQAVAIYEVPWRTDGGTEFQAAAKEAPPGDSKKEDPAKQA